MGQPATGYALLPTISCAIAWVVFTDKSMPALWRWRTCDFALTADKCDLQQNRRPARHYRERCSDGLGVRWISAWKLCPQLSVTR